MSNPVAVNVRNAVIKKVKELYLHGIRYNFQEHATGDGIRINVFTSEGAKYFDVTIKEVQS